MESLRKIPEFLHESNLLQKTAGAELGWLVAAPFRRHLPNDGGLYGLNYKTQASAQSVEYHVVDIDSPRITHEA